MYVYRTHAILSSNSKPDFELRSSYAPAAEDTAAEAERRAARAREVAVDFAWVVAESRRASTVSLIPSSHCTFDVHGCVVRIYFV